jgi:hypothetical protein
MTVDPHFTWNTQATLISDLKSQLAACREMLDLYRDINSQQKTLLEMKTNPVYIVGEKS